MTSIINVEILDDTFRIPVGRKHQCAPTAYIHRLKYQLAHFVGLQELKSSLILGFDDVEEVDVNSLTHIYSEYHEFMGSSTVANKIIFLKVALE